VGRNKIALINSGGKLILESKTNKIKDKTYLKILEFRDFGRQYVKKDLK